MLLLKHLLKLARLIADRAPIYFSLAIWYTCKRWKNVCECVLKRFQEFFLDRLLPLLLLHQCQAAGYILVGFCVFLHVRHWRWYFCVRRVVHLNIHNLNFDVSCFVIILCRLNATQNKWPWTCPFRSRPVWPFMAWKCARAAFPARRLGYEGGWAVCLKSL